MIWFAGHLRAEDRTGLSCNIAAFSQEVHRKSGFYPWRGAPLFITNPERCTKFRLFIEVLINKYPRL